jgi:hypothetical protein
VGRRLAVRSGLLRLRRLDRRARLWRWAALAGAIVLGPRLGKYKDGKVNPMPGSNLALATLGMFILWLGWFGFNGGSQLAMGSAVTSPTSRGSSPTPTWPLPPVPSPR